MSQQIDEPMVRLAIDANVCIGAGQCEMVEPNTFIVDDETAIARIIDSPALPKPRAQHVAERCPSGAISISHSADGPNSRPQPAADLRRVPPS